MEDENPNYGKIFIPSEDWENIYNSTLPNQPWWDQIEIDVSHISTIFDCIDTTLTQNGYYILVENENGEVYPDLIQDYQEGGVYDIQVDVPPPPQPTIGFANITTNGQYLPSDFDSQGQYDPNNPNNNFDYLNQVTVQVQENQTLTNKQYTLNYSLPNTSNLTIENVMDSPSSSYDGVDKSSTLIIQPTLQTLSNKRLQSQITYTINDLMDPSTRDNCWGITKDSTLTVDIPEPVYPEITFSTIHTNGTYKLNQLTNNQSTAFDSNSKVVVNNSIKIKSLFYNYATWSMSNGFYYINDNTNKVNFTPTYYPNGYNDNHGNYNTDYIVFNNESNYLTIGYYEIGISTLVQFKSGSYVYKMTANDPVVSSTDFINIKGVDEDNNVYLLLSVRLEGGNVWSYQQGTEYNFIYDP